MREESTTPNLAMRVRDLVETASRREWDAALRSWAPDAVWDASHRGVGKFEGVAAIRGLWREWSGAYDEWRIEIEEILELGNGVVLPWCCREAARFTVSVTSRRTMHGSTSGRMAWSCG
jgi:limonene-1,2-epoxide hydrolase